MIHGVMSEEKLLELLKEPSEALLSALGADRPEIDIGPALLEQIGETLEAVRNQHLARRSNFFVSAPPELDIVVWGIKRGKCF